MKRFLFLAILAGGICAAQTPARVKVDGGLLQGTAEDGLTVYRGIPFAAPPVGDLRWRAPQPAAKWEGVKSADKFGARCYQGGRGAAGVDTSEDCLYLNVWSPAKSANDHIPVLVWIYGGGFSAGATSEPTYSGEKLAKRGVVLVSIAYRVGQIGFLAHPELSAENRNHVSGNYGLLDMIAGLQWVQRNIAAFGGDPHHVTIFGESAGGIAVSMLCASPLAKGLFQGAISQSGGSFGPPRPGATQPGREHEETGGCGTSGAAYAKSAGASSIADLRKITADKLPAGGRGGGMSWPIIDGYVIPDDQYKLYSAGKFNDTPILVGYNSDEGQTFSRPLDAGRLYRLREGAVRPVCRQAHQGLSARRRKGVEDRARSGPRRYVRLAHMDLGSAAIAERKVQGLPLLLRSASGISGRFSARRIRLAARRGCGLCVPASESVESADAERTWRSRTLWRPTGRTSPNTAIRTGRAFRSGRSSATRTPW